MSRTDAAAKPVKTATQALRIVGALLNSALWAMAIALLFSKWTWLEMRFNIGWIFIGAWVAIFALILWRAEKPLGFAFSIANTLTCAIVYFALSGGFAGLQMVPASLVREGLRQTSWSIAAVNIGMLAFVGCCLAAIAALEATQRVNAATSTSGNG